MPAHLEVILKKAGGKIFSSLILRPLQGHPALPKPKKPPQTLVSLNVPLIKKVKDPLLILEFRHNLETNLNVLRTFWSRFHD
jgi:hypothetical protein